MNYKNMDEPALRRTLKIIENEIKDRADQARAGAATNKILVATIEFEKLTALLKKKPRYTILLEDKVLWCIRQTIESIEKLYENIEDIEREEDL